MYASMGGGAEVMKQGMLVNDCIISFICFSIPFVKSTKLKRKNAKPTTGFIYFVTLYGII